MEKFARAEQTPNTQAKTEMASANAEFVTRKAPSFRPLRTKARWRQPATTRMAGRFSAKGTRQKILSQEDKPLTIDEVRELLNKSK